MVIREKKNWYYCSCGKPFKSEARSSNGLVLFRLKCVSCGIYSPWRGSIGLCAATLDSTT